MKIAIVGSRKPPITYNQWEALYVELILSHYPTEIVSGAAEGIDSYARTFARAHNIPITEFPPDYKKYGRRAPLVRNSLIVNYADSVIAFPCNSRGTYDTINKAIKAKKLAKVIEL